MTAFNYICVTDKRQGIPARPESQNMDIEPGDSLYGGIDICHLANVNTLGNDYLLTVCPYFGYSVSPGFLDAYL